MKADIFILTDFKPMRHMNGHYVYLLRCITSKGEITSWDISKRKDTTVFEIENATQNQAELTALRDALRHMTKPSELDIYTDCNYLENGMRWSINWIATEWKNAKGEPVANAELWKEVLELISIHTLKFHTKEHHEYYKVMQTALSKADVNKTKGEKADGDNDR